MPPQDGAYDSGAERFALSLGALAPGTYKVEFEARNSNGLGPVKPDTTRI